MVCYLDNFKPGGGLGVKEVEEPRVDSVLQDVLEGVQQVLGGREKVVLVVSDTENKMSQREGKGQSRNKLRYIRTKSFV